MEPRERPKTFTPGEQSAIVLEGLRGETGCCVAPGGRCRPGDTRRSSATGRKPGVGGLDRHQGLPLLRSIEATLRLHRFTL